MTRYPAVVKAKACELRLQGYVYSEINESLSLTIPKSTLSHWFNDLILSEEAKIRIYQTMVRHGEPARLKSHESTRIKRQALVAGIYQQIEQEYQTLDKWSAKLILAMLYLGEGGKAGSEFVRFGNSNPEIIMIFMDLFRTCYEIDEKRLRGRLQCRDDQNKTGLERFWSDLTGIPTTQYYPTYVDKRTIGIPTKKLDYKGVFSVTYCSNKIFLELKFISDIISQLAREYRYYNESKY